MLCRVKMGSAVLLYTVSLYARRQLAVTSPSVTANRLFWRVGKPTWKLMGAAVSSKGSCRGDQHWRGTTCDVVLQLKVDK